MSTMDDDNKLNEAPHFRTSNAIELQQRIKEEFSVKYNPETCHHIAVKLVQWFAAHQYDTWESIVDEISCSFEDSSCQELLSHELNITNETEKREIHHLLQQCLTSSLVRTNDLEPIYNDILVVFTRIFGVEFADQIKECLVAVIRENGIQSIESIQQKSKHIIQTVVKSDTLPSLSGKQLKLLSEGMHHILNRKTSEFERQMETKQNVEEKEYGQSTNEQDEQMENVIGIIPRRLSAYFMQTFNNKVMAQIISQQFTHCINDEGFEEVETIQVDVETVEESTILQHIMDQLDASKSVRESLDDTKRHQIQCKIQEIILQCISSDALRSKERINGKYSQNAKRQSNVTHPINTINPTKPTKPNKPVRREPKRTEEQERILKMIEDRVKSILLPMQKVKTNRRPDR